MSGGQTSPSSSGSALVAELSLSFREELTASIQSALGVAVEIAVVEVTKLVGHALRDVRDQMHETLRDNKVLESRLRAAETELRAVRERLAEAQRQQRQAQVMIAVDTSLSAGSRLQPAVHEQASAPTDVDLSPERIAECLADVERKFEVGASREANGYEGSSFCEIREDGSVCTQDLKPDLLAKEESSAHLESSAHQEAKSELAGGKDDHHSIQDNSHFDQTCVRLANEPATSALMEESAMLDAGTAVSEVAVKVEKTEQCNGPDSEQESFGSDCLSLAQSRLLDDWRPEQLQLQSNSYTSSASNTLADPSIFPGEIPDLDFLTSAAPSQSDPFPAPPHSHRDAASLSSHAPHQLYPAHGSAPSHVCKVCGQSFSRQEDLRRHRSLMHPKQTGHHHRGPKRSLFPPGRSPYHCSQCGRDFNRMEHLKIHQRIHTGERPYVCTVCSARFRHSWALKRHFRIHTGEMPYQCGQCGKTFRNCGGLKFHQRSHARGQV
ncbi:zinc finger and SCAN domain-containing protein 21 isoform X1 [Colossoma macropomum]|uniref:zinc finger and SCAN domain-containing protein 21 isoform X1 n=1 Tax=Colossoma macropomum TaxID=42526 RepID=UPI001863BD90|nr:zinc finger and SCAN domain-containing protein 21 isoform X1 [Colossoma macropomum]